MPPASAAAPLHGAATLTVPGWAELLPGLLHGFSTGLPGADEAAVARQAAALAERALGATGAPVVLMSQPHGRNLVDFGNGDAPALAAGPVAGVDGALSDARLGHVLFVKSADCVPVLALDPERGAYAALHAGWRGVAAGILPALLESWRRAGSSLTQARLAFGPHIRACCFQVRQDCIARFAPEDLAGALQGGNGTAAIALESALRNQALRFGIAGERIAALPECTACHESPPGRPVFASHRRAVRSGTAPAGRNLSFIGIRPPARERG
jgi:hypothetical protein